MREESGRGTAAHRAAGVGGIGRNRKDLDFPSKLMRDDRLREDRAAVVHVPLGADVTSDAKGERSWNGGRLLEDDVLSGELDVVEDVAADEGELQVAPHCP